MTTRRSSALAVVVFALAVGGWLTDRAGAAAEVLPAGVPALAPPAVQPGAPVASDEGEPAWDLAALEKAGVRPEDLRGPHPIEADRSHPDKRAVEPALGGRVIQHISAQPANLNKAIENSAITTYILREIHAGLVERNWETWEYEPAVARAVDIEDTLVLKGGRTPDNGNIVYGRVTEEGDAYVVRAGSERNPLQERRIPKDQVESLERATVFTFHLRDGVTWHDGHPFDAHDAYFSWELFGNPHVDCDKTRGQFEEIVHGEVLDDRTVRFFYRQQYMDALATFDVSTFCLLPRHLYDLRDPDHARHDADATPEEWATEINENPHNIDFVGLGPYRLTEWKRDDYLEAQAFDGYFWKDPERAGYMDTLRWKIVTNDDTAFEALINGELDIFDRVKTEDYFGDKTRTEVFTNSFYKAVTYTGRYQYTAWNTYRPKLADPLVRQALAHAFDSQGWVDSKYWGLAWAITGSPFFLTPNYDHSLPLREYDPELARDMLAEAGWYDRDGNDIVDKDGEDLVIEILVPQGNKASESTVQKIQEGFSQAGVRVEMQPLEWASFLERVYNRDFDAANLATVLTGGVETDPKLTWHSEEGAFDKRSSNRSGLRDPEVDRLCDAIRREIDPGKRAPLWRELHRRQYELAPYLFMNTPAAKIAFSKKLRGVKLYVFSPGYRLRDMYYEAGTPGTRPVPPDLSRAR